MALIIKRVKVITKFILTKKPNLLGELIIVYNETAPHKIHCHIKPVDISNPKPGPVWPFVRQTASDLICTFKQNPKWSF